MWHLKHCSYSLQTLNREVAICNAPGGGGVIRFELDRGVSLEPQNPYPSLRVILAKKGTHFKGFSF